MPQQEKFFEHRTATVRVEVLKTYDQSYAREAFGYMDDSARAHLWTSLGIEGDFDPIEIPPQQSPDRDDFLWEALLENAREDGSLLSFFVVNESEGGRLKSLYVSPDWPSAEAFAKTRVATTR